MEETFYCPECSSNLERLYACGSESYYCNKCNKLISRNKMLNEKEIVSKVVKLVTEELKDRDLGIK